LSQSIEYWSKSELRAAKCRDEKKGREKSMASRGKRNKCYTMYAGENVEFEKREQKQYRSA